MNTYGGYTTSTTCTRSSYSGSGSGGSGVVSPPPSTADGNSTRTETNSVISNASYQDPVTKAVVENIMGRLPTTKPKMSLTCDICKLEFSSEIPMEMHMLGSKHAKRLKSQEILQNLKQGGQTFHQDVSNNVLRCEICDVVVNSSQQLQTHLTGSKHKMKAGKRNRTEPSSNNSEEPDAKAVCVKSEAAMDTEATPNGEKPNGEVTEKAMEPGSGIQVVAEGSANKSGKFFCETCKIALNSEIQLQQHTASKKHKDRLMGVKRPPMKTKKNWFWLKKKKNAGGAGVGFVPSSTNNIAEMPPAPAPAPPFSDVVKGEAMA